MTSLYFLDDLLLLQAGQALQAHLQDLARLRVREPVRTVVLQPRAGLDIVRAQRRGIP